MPNKHSAEIGIIGGTGLYDPNFFENVRQVKVETTYGKPSDEITLGDKVATEWAGKGILCVTSATKDR